MKSERMWKIKKHHFVLLLKKSIYRKKIFTLFLNHGWKLTYINDMLHVDIQKC